MTSHQQQLINQCQALFGQRVIVNDQAWSFYKKFYGQNGKSLRGKVVGWLFDDSGEIDDEPQVIVKFDSDLPQTWANETDFVSLSQIELSSLAACA